jgi:hypothetical protein
LKFFNRTKDEQAQGKSELLSRLIDEIGMEDLINFETDLSGRQNQVLFQIATEIEDTEGALRQAEQLIKKLKKHLEQLKDLQRVLSR